MKRLGYLGLAFSLLLLAGVVRADEPVWEKVNGAWVGTETQVFEVGPGGRVEVTDVRADVIVTGTDREDVSYRYIYRADRGVKKDAAEKRFSEEPLDVAATSRSLLIEGQKRRNHWFNRDEGSFTIELVVPRSMDLTLATAGGEIEVETVEGRLQASAAGGDITGRKLKGNLRWTSAGGDIDVTDTEGEVRLNSSGGDLTVERCTGDLRLSTSGGDCEVTAVKGDLDVQSSGGDIDLDDIDVTVLDLQAHGGDINAYSISASEPASLQSHGGDIDLEKTHGEFTLGSHGGSLYARGHVGDLRAETSGGDLTVDGLDGGLIASQVAGDTYVALAEGADLSEDWAISMISGDVTVAFPAKTAALIDAKVAHGGGSSIRSDFDLDIDEHHGTSVARGAINGGGLAKVTLSLNTGTIRIKKL